jgi:CheY-like chemotaxis protein
MNRERLDQILIRKGMVTEEQIRQALLRQKTHGGMIGSHLLYFKFLSEKQVLEALEEQFDLPGVQLTGIEVPEEILRKVPLKLVVEHLVFPFRYDAPTRTLHLAVLDPENQDVVQLVRQTSMAREVKVYLSVETVLRHAIQVHYFGQPRNEPLPQIVELPELFGKEAAPEEPGPASATREAESRAEVLIVTQAVFLKSFLVPIFEREGYRLEILADAESIRGYLKGCSPDHILLGVDLETDFSRWIEEGLIPCPESPPVAFAGVSRSLLENPIPYPRTAASLLQALQQAAEYRCRENDWLPPFSLLCQEIRNLALGLGLGRLAADGLQIAALLLTPSRHAASAQPAKRVDLGIDFFTDVSDSLAWARAIDFPWNVDLCLRSFFRFLSGRSDPAAVEDRLSPGAHILALVWLRHSGLHGVAASPEQTVQMFKEHLHGKVGRLYDAEVVEAYLQLLDKQKDRPRTRSQKDIFIVSEPGQTAGLLSKHLRQQGYRTVEIRDFSEAHHLYARKQPDVIILNYDQHPEHALALCHRVRTESRTLLYAFTAEDRPSLVLRLLGAGFNDVFGPPFNFDIVATRISNSLAVLARLEELAAGTYGFGASFRELPFVDLIQALAQSQRSVHLKIARRNGEGASIFLRNGRMIHARCGSLTGEEAVFQIIRWQDDGSFRLESAQEFPADNLASPTDYVLMEGCRRLDEGGG